MNENLNLTEILKDCSKGTKFYSRCLGSVEFCKITLDNYIEVTSKNGCYIRFKSNGTYQHSEETAEIDLFPSKDQRDWNKWNRPFINGDIVHGNNNCCSYISIYKSDRENNSFHYYASLSTYGGFKTDDYVDKRNLRFATEEEKQKLFDAIKSRGYKWDDKTKILEKLVEPKFKVGDVIRLKNGLQAYKITNVTSEYYSTKVPDHACVGLLPIKDQNDWILISNKFDPKTLQPFDKVLVRDIGCETRWHIQFFETMYDNKKYPFMCLGDKVYSFCIPYNDNTKHLVGKSEEAPEFYRYWED